ncbi:hypothetical protein [Actinophytocola sp.]|uniref:hypothetical protein n=1 Tax=Actinophytocola sp. TaxID=1872138 RepID=UPI002ED1BA64
MPTVLVVRAVLGMPAVFLVPAVLGMPAVLLVPAVLGMPAVFFVPVVLVVPAVLLVPAVVLGVLAVFLVPAVLVVRIVPTVLVMPGRGVLGVFLVLVVPGVFLVFGVPALAVWRGVLVVVAVFVGYALWGNSVRALAGGVPEFGNGEIQLPRHLGRLRDRQPHARRWHRVPHALHIGVKTIADDEEDVRLGGVQRGPPTSFADGAFGGQSCRRATQPGRHKGAGRGEPQ